MTLGVSRRGQRSHGEQRELRDGARLDLPAALIKHTAAEERTREGGKERGRAEERTRDGRKERELG